MGGRSGGLTGKGGLMPGDGNAQPIDIKNEEDLKNIKDPQVYKEMKAAISRFYKELGMPQRKVKLADLPPTVAGVHVTFNGKSEGVYLKKSIFKNMSKAKIEKIEKDGYKSGWSTKTNKPIAHVVTHELAHSVWNKHLTGAKHIAAGKEINKVYHSWLRDKKKTGYGEYAKTNVSEFFAETITKGIHGKADKYTKQLKSIVKKYKL